MVRINLDFLRNFETPASDITALIFKALTTKITWKILK